MNKRIRELEDQAGYIQVDDRFSGGYITFNTEKFAELIIQECIEIVDSGYLIGPGNQIRQHFGVE